MENSPRGPGFCPVATAENRWLGSAILQLQRCERTVAADFHTSRRLSEQRILTRAKTRDELQLSASSRLTMIEQDCRQSGAR